MALQSLVNAPIEIKFTPVSAMATKVSVLTLPDASSLASAPCSLLNPTQQVTLDGFFDANAHVGYHINDRLSVYAKANNMASQNYERWLNYPVQGFQALAGATYKFDF